jgi:diguanylate cyclase (GGDEF)-like protein
MRMALGSAPAGDVDVSRNRMLGRCAGMLFIAGAVASAPANQLLTNPDPGWHMHVINLLALVSGVVCLLLPWERLPSATLHLIPFVATGEIVLTVTALGVHGEVYLWYFVLGAVFTGYAFRNRWHIAGHMATSGAGFLSTALFSFGWDQDALVRALVAVPTLWVAAGIVTWLREGLEVREAVARQLMQEREHEARTDSLTGLGNRRALMTALDGAADPGAAPRTLGLFDLDGFKLFNDRFGHPAGDALLERMAVRLLHALDGRGAAFRLGGDEFCVVIDGVDRELVAACAEALAERATDFEITASWGAVVLPEEADSTFAALSTADHRMYAIKEQRRGPGEPVSLSSHERREGPRAAV